MHLRLAWLLLLVQPTWEDYNVFYLPFCYWNNTAYYFWWWNPNLIKFSEGTVFSFFLFTFNHHLSNKPLSLCVCWWRGITSLMNGCRRENEDTMSADWMKRNQLASKQVKCHPIWLLGGSPTRDRGMGIGMCGMLTLIRFIDYNSSSNLSDDEHNEKLLKSSPKGRESWARSMT